MSNIVNKETLEKIYGKYNRRKYVHPDPLEFLYDYENVRDREIAALIASSLAYGRVRQILKSVSIVLKRMAPSPSVYLKKSGKLEIQKTFADFKHRFTTGGDVACLLVGMKSAIERHGSLEKCFLSGLKKEDQTVLEALSSFEKSLSCRASLNLIPSAEKKSACKRLNLFLRWMVRKDAVDPGGWTKVPKSKLIIPLDTHMHRIARELGLTKRKQANLKTAIEVTNAFAAFAPDDPVRYDFVLTRFGIHDEIKKLSLKEECHGKQDVLLSV